MNEQKPEPLTEARKLADKAMDVAFDYAMASRSNEVAVHKRYLKSILAKLVALASSGEAASAPQGAPKLIAEVREDKRLGKMFIATLGDADLEPGMKLYALAAPQGGAPALLSPDQLPAERSAAFLNWWHDTGRKLEWVDAVSAETGFEAGLRAPQGGAGLRTVFDEVRNERKRQDAKWGGAEHDDQHSTVDFATFIANYAARAMSATGYRAPTAANKRARHRLVQVAALAVAAIESIDRRTRDEHERVYGKTLGEGEPTALAGAAPEPSKPLGQPAE